MDLRPYCPAGDPAKLIELGPIHDPEDRLPTHYHLDPDTDTILAVRGGQWSIVGDVETAEALIGYRPPGDHRPEGQVAAVVGMIRGPRPAPNETERRLAGTR